MKHSFAPNPDLGICPSLRRSQSCWWGRQTQPGNGIAINKEQRDYSDMCLYVHQYQNWRPPVSSGESERGPG